MDEINDRGRIQHRLINQISPGKSGKSHPALYPLRMILFAHNHSILLTAASFGWTDVAAAADRLR